MNNEAMQLLTQEKVGVISVVLEDGTPHAATIHFSHEDNPLRIYIFTSNTSLKAQPFLEGKVAPAAFVVGFSLEQWKTLQMHGTMQIISDSVALESIYAVQYAKHPETEKHRGPKTAVLEFTPTWWRYSDFKTAPPTIVQS